MSLCRILNVKCARCDRVAKLAHEGNTHQMHWPLDILEIILSKIDTTDRDMLRARLKKRLWGKVHKELNDNWVCRTSVWGWEYGRSGVLGIYFFDKHHTIQSGGRMKLKLPYIIVTNNESYEPFLDDCGEDWWEYDMFEMREDNFRSYSYRRWDRY
jgi:hypothetical protein